MQLNPLASINRPALAGRLGAVAAAHPLAVAAGQRLLAEGGNAVDAMIAAQAALAVVTPDACGLGGDGFVLLRRPGRPVLSINGAGPSARAATRTATTGGAAVTVPGLIDLWDRLSSEAGRLGLAKALQPAIEIAEQGFRADEGLIEARDGQLERLRAGGAEPWALMQLARNETFVQPALAALLRGIAERGREAFYEGAMAAAIARAVQACGGALSADDLAPPVAEMKEPLSLRLGDHVLHVQPPQSQGVLLLMALNGFHRGGFGPEANLAHLAVELTQAAFAHRDDVARGVALLEERLEVDPERAQRRGGPRAYLHTAGVTAADAEGNVASSLVSVFDDFGSAVFVPEGGFTLTNRAGGFTGGANAFAPGKRPVHTLAPALLETPDGAVALSTPGADGQVQTLLQVILDWTVRGRDLAEAVAAPRWRSEDGKLLIEAGHPAGDDLRARGHEVVELSAGDVRFGAVTMSGSHQGTPFALADWRRMTWAGVA
jgi:gamma-glutamyltranspeptidase/glutathione hydrolase